ncbi:MAG: hypothetical protein AABX13_02135 [Nanoarchaeota archaeon]
MYQTEISPLNGNTETHNLVYTNNIASTSNFVDALASSARPYTLDVVVQYASKDFYEEEGDDLLDDSDDGKLSEELEGVVYGNGSSDTFEQHYFPPEEDEPKYDQPDFMLVDRYFASLFEENEDISYLSPLASLYKPLEYDPSLYVLFLGGELGETGEEVGFGELEAEPAEESEKSTGFGGIITASRHGFDLEERLIA